MTSSRRCESLRGESSESLAGRLALVDMEPQDHLQINIFASAEAGTRILAL